MKTNHIQNNTFTAKLYPYPKTITNKKILKDFEEKTRNYPNLILKQDDISYVDKDYFLLFENNGKVLNFKTEVFTSNNSAYKTVDEITDRFVQIFHNMLKK